MKQPAKRQGADRGSPGFYLLLPLLGLMASFLVWLALLNPMLLDILLEGANSPYSLIRGYRDWYFILLLGAVAGCLPIIVCGIFSVRYFSAHLSETDIAFRYQSVVVVRFQEYKRVSKFFLKALLCFYGVLIVMANTVENIPLLLWQSEQDMAQIESGELERVSVWLHPRGQKEGLPGFYADGQPEPATRYGGISGETDGEWVFFYVPDCLNFALEQDALYNEDMNLAWNTEHATQYRLTYTANLHVVTAAEPVSAAMKEPSSCN